MYPRLCTYWHCRFVKSFWTSQLATYLAAIALEGCSKANHSEKAKAFTIWWAICPSGGARCCVTTHSHVAHRCPWMQMGSTFMELVMKSESTLAKWESLQRQSSGAFAFVKLKHATSQVFLVCHLLLGSIVNLLMNRSLSTSFWSYFRIAILRTCGSMHTWDW
jgi:hypothetical protein